MTRAIGTLIRTLIDLLVLSLAYFCAYAARFDGVPPLQMIKLLMFTWPYVVAFELLVLYLFSVPHFAWRYVSLREAQRVLAATATTSAVLLVVRLVSPSLMRYVDYMQYALIPIGVLAVNAGLAFLGITGVRFARRIMVEHTRSSGLRRREVDRVPTLLLGAGQAGVMIAKEIGSRPDLAIQAVGFLDDDVRKIGTIVHGVRVLGTSAQIEEVTAAYGVKQAIITVANATGAEIRRLARLCERAEIPVKIIPGIYELLDGKVSLTRLRDVSIEDLLRREAVQLDTELVEDFLCGKRVLITGAGGSIGSELCRQVARFRPASLVLVEQSEFHLFTIHQELLGSCLDFQVKPRICDVCDADRLEAVFAAELPEVVFHAAAHKHVPMMESNPGEAIKNNVFGTKAVADAADRHGSKAFVLISTDKAVNPTSVMGATKRVAELYVQALSLSSRTKFVAVRFGNVLGSTGSVIPIFKAQIAVGGPVTVTHREMTRYFMTIPEASQLVMQSAAMGETGEIMVLDMGEPVRIAELAEELIRLSGLQPGIDIDIVYSGIRPGEKLFEELSFDAEKMSKTRHEKIFVGNLKPSELASVQVGLSRLSKVINSGSSDEVRRALGAVVPEMRAPDDDRNERPLDRAPREDDVLEQGLVHATAEG